MSSSALASLTLANVRGYVDPFIVAFGKGKGLGKATKYWTPVVGSFGGPVTVKLKATDAAYSVSVENGNVFWVPTTPKARVAVLRRPLILRIFTATAAERYKAIAELVDVSGVEASEQALAKLVKDTERDVQEETSRRDVGNWPLFASLDEMRRK